MPKVFEAPPGFVLNPDYLVPELRAQRDALLEACKLALEQISPNYYRTRDTLRAAIRTVEGGA